MASQDPASSGTEDSPHDSGSRREITILAVSLGVVGLIAAGVIGFVVGRSGEEAAPSSEAPPQASGSVLSWEGGDTLDIAFVASVAKFQDSYWAFGEDVASFESETVAVRAYRSDDGRRWTDLGVVIAGGRLSDITSTGEELIAVGSFHEEPLRSRGFGLPGSIAAVWRSADGTSWQQSDLPFSAEPGIDYWAIAHATAVNRERAVIFGSASPNFEAAIESAIPQEYQPLLGPEGFGMGMGGPPFSVQIHGPFGITVFSASFEELGIDTDAAAEYFMGPGDAGGLVWTSESLESWEVSESLGESVNEVVVGPTGEFIAHGYGHRGPMLWTSPDGLSWESKSAPEGLGEISVFGDRLIATNHTPFGVAQLVASSDAETWETITPEDLLDGSGGMWDYGPLSASDYGVVSIAMSYPDEPVVSDMEPPRAVVITKDGITVTADDMEGSITVTRGDEVLLKINTWMEQVPDEIAFDVPSRSMTFVDPESGENLVTITFDEIAAAQRDVFDQFEPTSAQSVIVFSPDAEQWSTQSTVDAFGVDTFFSPVFAFDDLVIATVQVFEEGPVFDPMDFVPPPTQMWVGALS